MDSKDLQFGSVTIDFPDKHSRYFTIFQDLTELFSVEVQSEAIKLLKKKLAEIHDLKPKPDIDFEADTADISSTNADTIFKVAECINLLTVEKLRVNVSPEQKAQILVTLKAWKRPKPQKWETGDIFSITISDGTYVFGQILPEAPYSSLCAVFVLRKNNQDYTVNELKEAKIMTVLGIEPYLLNDGTYKVVGHEEVLVDPVMCVHKNSSFGDSFLKKLAETYYGLEPWDREIRFDLYLAEGTECPEGAIILTPYARAEYRKKLG